MSGPLFAQQDTNHLSATILGSESLKFDMERSEPSVLASYKNTRILVEMGNNTQTQIHKLKVKVKDLGALLFTHHHLDHNEEFAPIFIQSLTWR